jgi:DinB family protein
VHPRIQELLDYAGTQRAVLRRAFDSVPPDLRDQPAEPGRWSTAGIIEHLAIVSRRVAKLMTLRVGEARAAGIAVEARTDPILPTLDLDRVLDRSMRVEAPPMIHPTGLSADAAWASLEAATVPFREAVMNADGLALANITHPHPLFGPLTMYEWIAFVGGHEARHAAQIVELAAKHRP